VRRLQVFQEHGEALCNWAQRGFRAEKLVIFDEHLDFKYIDEARVEHLRACEKSTSLLSKHNRCSAAECRDGYLYGYDDFLYAAWKLGMLSQVIWVLPPNADFAQSLWRSLEHVRGATIDTLNSWRCTDNDAEITFGGLHIIATTCDELVKLDLTSARVDIDLDYFDSCYPDVDGEIERFCSLLERIGIVSEVQTATLSVTTGFLRKEGLALPSKLTTRLGLSAVYGTSPDYLFHWDKIRSNEGRERNERALRLIQQGHFKDSD
jgi:hypothetical protein